MGQNFTSRATAVNGKAGKLPAIYKKLDLENVAVLDIGCGAEVDHINTYVIAKGGFWWGIDPYNQTASHNITTLANWDIASAVCENMCLVISSNVLNVIDDEDALKEAVNQILEKSALGGYAVSVYEGNGSGVGKQTGRDQWQRNAKLKEYLKYFPADAVIVKGIVTNVPELVK